MPDLPAAALRVLEAASALGLAIDIRAMADSTRTAEEAALACGCAVDQIVKSLVFKGRDTGKAHLLLVSGRNRVDQEAVAADLGEALDRADAGFVRAATGYAIGGIPPFGHATAMPAWIDGHLLSFPLVWAAAGTPKTIFPIDPARLRDATGARVIPMA